MDYLTLLAIFFVILSQYSSLVVLITCERVPSTYYVPTSVDVGLLIMHIAVTIGARAHGRRATRKSHTLPRAAILPSQAQDSPV